MIKYLYKEKDTIVGVENKMFTLSNTYSDMNLADGQSLHEK